MKNITIQNLTGNGAAGTAFYLVDVDMFPAYPITPQTEIPETVRAFITQGLLDADFINMESEHSVLAAAMAGAFFGRVGTATSSQGLEYMHEVMTCVSGYRLPVVMVDVSRGLLAGWALWRDFNASMACRDTGWMQFYCQNAQEVLDTVIMAYRIAEMLKLPAMVIEEGFLLSHTSERVAVPSRELVDQFLPSYKMEVTLDPDDARTFGNLVWQTPYAESKYFADEDIKRAPEIASRICQEYSNLVGRECNMVLEAHNLEDAGTAIVSLGTIASTALDVIQDSPNLGLIRLKMFTPFPKKALLKVINEHLYVRDLVVIEPCLGPGHGGPVWRELRNALYRHEHAPRIYGVVTGLNGEDVTPDILQDVVSYALSKRDDREPILWRR